MTETITNLATYVDGYKVTSSTKTTLTLNNGVTINKNQCKYICTDAVEGATYYRYQDES